MIGLIFGETSLPIEILKKIKKKKIKYIIIDLTKSKKFRKDRKSFSVSVGQFGKIISILKDNKCKQVLFAGKVSKPNFSKLKLDLKGFYYIPRIIKASKLGDAAILKEIINILREQKIKTLNSLIFNPELTLKKGNYTKTRPNNKDMKDIQKAIKALSALGKYNFSQGVVVRNKKNYSGVLVKFPKKKQDLRIDLPTVGLKTLQQCNSAGIKGIVLKNKQNIFLEKKACINYANKNKMFVTVK